LSSVTSVSRVDVSLYEDLDWFAAPFLIVFQDRAGKSWSQEVRYTSGSSQPTRWVAGAFYQDTDQDIDSILGLGPTPYTTFPVARPTNKSRAAAAFGQINQDLTEAIELTMALRYDRDDREQQDRLGGGPNRKKAFDAWQPKVSLAYKFRDSMLYTTIARGFRSGGFNPPAGGFDAVYAAEKTTSFEVGAKSSWLDGRVQVNGAGFLTKFDDQQQFVLNGPNQGIVNIRKTEIRGIELELRSRPVADLELSAGVSLLDSKIKDFDGTALYHGNHVPLAYGFSSVLSAQYGIDLFGGRGSLRVDYTRRADNYWHIDNADKQSATDLVNASLNWERGPFRAQIWSRNTFDKKYTEEFFANEFLGLFGDIRYPGSPRRYGLSLSYSF
jgi:iron complex outermembrane recepter protein